MTIKFENTHGKYNMFGDLTTQRWAQQALPILVQCAHEHKTINYKEMAAWFDRKAYHAYGKSLWHYFNHII